MAINDATLAANMRRAYVKFLKVNYSSVRKSNLKGEHPILLSRETILAFYVTVDEVRANKSY